MSKKGLESFVEEIKGDPGLQEELRSAMDERTDEDAVPVFVELGRSRGAEFTRVEARQFLQALAQVCTDVEPEALDDDQLEMVVGGAGFADIESARESTRNARQRATTGFAAFDTNSVANALDAVLRSYRQMSYTTRNLSS